MQGIETNLKTISGLRTYAYRPDQVNPPAAYVSLPALNYDQAFNRGMFRVEPTVTVLVSKALDRVEEPLLSQFMDLTSSNSVRQAVESDRTLGLAGQIDCHVVSAHESDISLGGVLYYGAVFQLLVIAKGS